MRSDCAARRPPSQSTSSFSRSPASASSWRPLELFGRWRATTAFRARGSSRRSTSGSTCPSLRSSSRSRCPPASSSSTSARTPSSSPSSSSRRKASTSPLCLSSEVRAQSHRAPLTPLVRAHLAASSRTSSRSPCSSSEAATSCPSRIGVSPTASPRSATPSRSSTSSSSAASSAVRPSLSSALKLEDFCTSYWRCRGAYARASKLETCTYRVADLPAFARSAQFRAGHLVQHELHERHIGCSHRRRHDRLVRRSPAQVPRSGERSPPEQGGRGIRRIRSLWLVDSMPRCCIELCVSLECG